MAGPDILVIGKSSNLRVISTRGAFLGFVMVMEGALPIRVDLISHGSTSSGILRSFAFGGSLQI